MRKRTWFLWAAASALALVACSHKPKFESAKVDRYAELQAKQRKLGEKGVLAEVAIGESRDLQTGIDKAELAARAKLARSLESRVSSLARKFEEEAGSDLSSHFSLALKGVSDETLRGASLQDTRFEQDGEGKYRVYGLMVLDAAAFRKAMAAQIESDQALRDRWRASRAYKDLDAEIEAYREWKRQEEAPSEIQPSAGRGL
jgi:hypothetical protein